MAIRFEPKEPVKPAKAAVAAPPKPDAVEPPTARLKPASAPELPLGASAKPPAKGRSKRK